MSLVTDNNVNTTTGKWKRGRYGRAIAVMRLRKADGTKFVFDPASYKNNLEKLYNIGVRMKDSKQLPMFYEEYNGSKKYDNDDDMDYDFFDQKKSSHLDNDNDIQSNDNYNNVMNDTSIELSNTLTKVMENKGEERRLAAMERRLQEKEAKLELLNQVGKGKHVTFDNDDDDNELNKTISLQGGTDDDDDDDDDKDDENVLVTKQSQQPKDGTKWMFDSDEEDDDLNIRINPVLEGEKGRKRLELQSTFKGDDRFKLTEAFMDDDESDNDIESKQNQVVTDDITKSLDEEKDQSMNVLRAMFGDVKVMTQTKPSSDWSIGARYDPEAENANDYIIQSKNNELLNKQDDLMNDDSDGNDRYSGSEDNENEDMPIIKRTETEMPIVSTDKHFSVNVNLKPLFGAEEEPFKLFGGDNSEDDDDNKPTTPKRSLEDEYTSFIPKHTEAQVGLGLMFFLHNDDSQLIKKSCYSYDANGIFQRNENDGYIEEWKKNRSIIADVLKARLKNSTRQKKSNVKK
ncbi:unnamed protein product [Cunninghamella echinulata]